MHCLLTYLLHYLIVVASCTSISIRADHLSYWCNLEGEDGHNCSIQKTIVLDDGRWSLEGANETVDSRNQGAWTAVETVWEEPYIVTTEEKKLKPKEPGQGIVREVV